MLFEYIKKYCWVILTLLVAVIILIIALAGTSTPEPEFHGTFIHDVMEGTGGDPREA